MLKELEVYDFGTYVETITQIDAEQQYRMWFRGQSDYSWGLVPSVQRKDGMGEHYEQYITTNFMIHTMRLNPNAPQRYDRASWLTLMQHYGLPTRLLDWSESPLVALYFALSSDKDAKTDAAVWVLVLDHSECHKSLIRTLHFAMASESIVFFGRCLATISPPLWF